ncbi:MAG: hypothetical protein WA003_06460 [Desulfuromonadaceae bacterium]
MRFVNILIYIILALVVASLPGYATADELSLDVSKTLAVVPVKNGKVDKSVYRQFDRLVPKLKKISKNRMLKLECSYAGQPDREQDIDKAYHLAAQIQKYLYVRHKLDLDLWIGIDITSKSAKTSHVLTLTVLPESIKELGTVLIIPPNK